MRAFIAALQFLTILPAFRGIGISGKDMERCVIFFPLIGLLIGFLSYAFAALISMVFQPTVCCVLIVLFLVVISGGLHMDGLADTMDGFASSRSEVRMLEIMRDSRIGVMGVLSIIFIILLKVTFLFSMSHSFRMNAVVLMPLAGRCSVLIVMLLLNYVRQEGTGLVFSKNKRYIWLGLALGMILFITTALLLCSHTGAVMVLASILVALLFSAYCKKKIRGYTGDTLGATCEIVELVPAIVLAMIEGKV